MSRVLFDLDSVQSFALWRRLIKRLEASGIEIRTLVGALDGEIRGTIVFDKAHEDEVEQLLIELGLKNAPN